MQEAWLERLLLGAAALAAVLGYGLPDLGTSGFEPAPKDRDVVRVVTWNVGGAVGGDPHPLSDAGLDHVAEVLAALDADVVALQELASTGQARDLAERLGSDWTWRASPRGPALLAREADLRDIDLGRGDRRLGATVTVRGRVLGIANVHASAFDARERNRELGEATAALLDREDVEAHVLLGDLNLDVDLDKKRVLFSSRAHLDVETYNHVGGFLEDAARGRGSTAEPDRRLDYVFVSPEVVVEAAGPWKGRRSETMDHDPVVADLRTPD